MIECVLAAQEYGITALSAWGFSTENNSRTSEEVTGLMQFFAAIIEGSWKKLAAKNIQFRFAGNRALLPKKLLGVMDRVADKSKDNSGLIYTICLGYGGRDELVRTLQKIVRAGVSEDQVTEELVGNYLDTSGIPDVDLIIRTSGEQRLSGFFPWQSVYSELYFPTLFFPDFTSEEFDKALEWYGGRNRRFGK